MEVEVERQIRREPPPPPRPRQQTAEGVSAGSAQRPTAELTAVNPTVLTALQHAAGNAAVQRLMAGDEGPAGAQYTMAVQRDVTVQRNGGDTRKRLADYLAAVKDGRWADVANLLRGFSDQGLPQRIRGLSHDQRIRLVRAALHGAPPWAARIVTAVKSEDAEAERVGRLYADWDAAVAAGTWGPAALTLNAFSDVDLAALVTALPIGQLQDLKAGARAAMPGFADRVVNAADLRISGAVIAAGAALTGQLRWRGGQGPDDTAGYQISETTAWGHQDDFAKWIRGTGPEPGPTSTMNCWEAVLFFGFRAGVIPKSFLVSMHNDAAAAASAASPAAADAIWYQTLQARMHSGPLQTYTINLGTGVGAPLIPAGNIVFIDDLDHVVLSRGTRDGSGRMRVLSLWIFPAHLPPGPMSQATTYGVVQDTTVEEVVRTPASSVITFGRPPW